jgi:ATP-dependent Zn protease
MFFYRILIYTTVGKYLTKSWFQHFLKDGELDKESLIREMGILEEELFRSERELKFYDDKVNSFQNNKTTSSVFLLIGFLGIIFFFRFWFFWIFLIIMGGLAYITAISRQKTLRYTISIIEENLAAIKKDIAENRAKLLSL